MVIRVPASVVAAAAITRDVVFVKRDKNSKRDPINREGNTQVSGTKVYLMKMVKNKATMTESFVVEFFYSACLLFLTWIGEDVSFVNM